MSLLSKLTTSSSAITVYIPPGIYIPGSKIDGEVELNFQHLHEETIDEVVLRFKGQSKTCMDTNQSTMYDTIPLFYEETVLWTRGSSVFPPAGSHTLQVPFSFTLPQQLPPSFQFESPQTAQSSSIRYTLTAVGKRKGRFAVNKRHCVPIAVLPADRVGTEIKARNATHVMKMTSKEEKIRKGLWGDYSTVRIELSVPDIPVLPLYADIPYTVTIITTSAPVTRAKADAQAADKPVFPPAPASTNDVHFTLHRKLKLYALGSTYTHSHDVTSFLGESKKAIKASTASVDAEYPPREWFPLEGLGAKADEARTFQGKATGYTTAADSAVGPDTKGAWVQRATLNSTFRLDCPPTFALKNAQCDYQLLVKMVFPGMGNDVKLELPVRVTSGIDSCLAREPSAGADGGVAPPTLDLPPSYWAVDERDFDDIKER